MDVRSNIPALFLATLREHPQEQMLGLRQADGWNWLSSEQAGDAVREIAGGLIAGGLTPGARVALAAENRPEWALVDLAVQSAGGVLVPIYPTLSLDQTRFLLKDSGACAVFVSTSELASKIESVRAGTGCAELYGFEGEKATPLARLREVGREFLAHRSGALEERLAGLGPDELATIVYTSGTTGVPKGAMLTHANICHNVAACLDLFDFRSGDTALSFLPLSHIFERMVQYVFLQKGLRIAYVRSLERLADSIAETRPHVFVTVPRVLDRVAGRVREQIEQSTAIRRFVGRRALAWAESCADLFMRGERPRGLRGTRWLAADRLVLGRLRKRLGGRLRFVVSGGAALPASISRFFWAAAIPVFEGYGLTETAPVLCTNRPGHIRLGTVGPPIPGVEIRIAPDGEILARGPNVMQGYWQNDADTDEVLRGGWFHTGDLGGQEADGFVRISGRKKDILVLSTGKNVAPQAIEDAISQSPYVSRVIAVGDERPAIGLLIVPNFEMLERWARDNGLPEVDRETLLASPEVRRLMRSEIMRLQTRLSTFEKARQFEFLHEDLTEENGLLTPTQKVRRRAVVERHGHLVERLYK
jgi:long-chain acyl-CoA synthetase